MFYQRALELNPNYAQAYRDYAEIEEGEAGLKLIRKAVELEPGDPDHRYMLVIALASTNRRDEADVEVDRLIRQHPDYSRTYRQKAWRHFFFESRLDEAVLWLRRGLAVDPREAFSYYFIINIYRVLGDDVEAARWTERLLALSEYQSRHYWEAEIHALRGEEDEALLKFRRFIQDSIQEREVWFPGGHRALRYLLNADLRAGRIHEARARYESRYPIMFEEDLVISKFGQQTNNPRLAMQLAAVLTATGETEQANRLLDRARETYQRGYQSRWDHNDVYGIRDVCMYALRGERRRALDTLREAVEEGYRDRFCLDAVELDPLRDDPEFIAMMKEVDDDLALQLANVRRMEANGEFAEWPGLGDKSEEE